MLSCTEQKLIRVGVIILGGIVVLVLLGDPSKLGPSGLLACFATFVATAVAGFAVFWIQR